jgi:tetratricopeptide (TPR) repeat protein
MNDAPTLDLPTHAQESPDRPLWQTLILVVLVLAVFSQAFGAELVYDDTLLIGRIERLDSLSSLFAALGSSYWGFDEPDIATQIGYWRPLTVVFHYAAHTVGAGSPFVLHAASLLVHVLATLACLRLARRFTSDGVLAFLVALLFGLHPVHVESVLWVSAANDPLFALSALLAIDAFVVWRQQGSVGSPTRAALWFGASLLAKEHGLAVLPILLALDIGGGFRGKAGIARAYVPFAIVFGVYYLARAFVFGGVLAGFDLRNTDFALEFARAASFRVELFGGFLSLLAWPQELAFFRPLRPVLPPGDVTFLIACVATALWAGLTFVLWRKKAQPFLGLALCLPAAVLPVIASIDSAGLFPLSDRHLYLPVAAMVLLTGLSAARWLPRNAAYAVLVLIAIGYGTRSYARSALWHDEETMFRAAASESPKSAYVHWGLGRILLERFQVEERKELLDEALLEYLTSLMVGTDYGSHAPKLGPEASVHARVSELVRVISRTPGDQRKLDLTVWVSRDDRLQANLGQGFCYLGLGAYPPEYDLDFPRAIFVETTRLFPESFRAWSGLGAVHAARKEYEQAVAAFDKALELYPTFPDALYNRGLTYTEMRETEKAFADHMAAFELRPGNVKYMLGVARAAINLERYDKGQEFLSKAKQADPSSLEPLYLSGLLAAAKGQFTGAMNWVDKLHAKDPDHGLGHLLKGKIQISQKDTMGAIRSLGRACERLPTSFEAYYHQSSMLLYAEQYTEALPYIQRAYQLSPKSALRDELHANLIQLVEDPDEMFQYALLSERLGDWQLVLDWCNRSIALKATNPAVHHKRARACINLDGLEAAVEAMTTAYELDPDSFWVKYELGELLLMRVERPKEALPYLLAARAEMDGIQLPDERVRQQLRQQLDLMVKTAEEAD